MTSTNAKSGTQTIKLVANAKQTEKIVVKPGQAIQLMVDGQLYTGQKTINGLGVRMVRKGDKLILEVEGQDQALVEVSGFFPAELAAEQAAATQDLLGTVDAQALFEAGSSAQLASAELGTLPTASTPSWGTLIAQASTGAATTTAATTTAAATTTTAAAAAGGIPAWVIAAGASLVAAAAISSNNDDAPVAQKPNDAKPTITGLPGSAQSVTTGAAAALDDFTVADTDSTNLTVTLTATNGTIGGVTDADANTAGIQLTGTAAQINTALAAATFTAAAAGAASIGVSVSDGVNTAVTGTYNMTASPLVLGALTNLNLSDESDSVGAGKLNGVAGTNQDNLTNITNGLVVSGGGASAGSTIKLFNDVNNNGVIDSGELIGTTTANGASWSLTTTTSLGNGAHNLKAVQSLNGVDSQASSSMQITISNSTPTAPASGDSSNKESWINSKMYTDSLHTNAVRLTETLTEPSPYGATSVDGIFAAPFTAGGKAIFDADFNVTSGTTYTTSLLVKEAGTNTGDFVVAFIRDGGASQFDYAAFNLETGQVAGTNISSPDAVQITPVGMSGWYQVTITVAASGTSNGGYFLGLKNSANESDFTVGENETGILVQGLTFNDQGHTASTAPVFQGITMLNDQGGFIIKGGSTNDATPTLVLMNPASDNLALKFYDNNTLIQHTQVLDSASNTYSIDFTNQFSTGNHVLTAKFEDVYGNLTSSLNVYSFTVI